MPGVERNMIFISYRRDDSMGASGRVCDWLRIGFGRDRVFRDVDSMIPGFWKPQIDLALAASKACVAVIGRRWADETNLPRLHDSNDMVRHELETALVSGKRGELAVIPLLVEEVKLPQDQLPEVLRSLLGCQAFEITENGYHDDTRRLIDKIASATGLPVNPDLEKWMSLTTGASKAMSLASDGDLQGAIGRQGRERSIEGLLHRAAEAEPAERPALMQALAALASGNTLLAEESFEREIEASRRVRLAAQQLAATEQRREADAARNVASLAVVRGDLPKAVRYFQIALDANPEDLDAALQLGYAWISLGDLSQARIVFEKAGRQARILGDPRLEGWALNGLGDVKVAQGDGPGALEAYEAGLAIAEALSKRDPANTQSQRDLLVIYDRMGVTKLAQGDRPEALAAYKAALSITEALTMRDPANTEWQRDFSMISNKIGDLKVDQGDSLGALTAYEIGLTIRSALTKMEPANIEWQRDLSVSYERIGDVKVAQGDGPGALEAYEAGLAIREALSKRDPANTQWQVDVAVSCARLGSMNALLPVSARKDYLNRGRDILLSLKRTGRLHANQDWIGWFDEAIERLGEAS